MFRTSGVARSADQYQTVSGLFGGADVVAAGRRLGARRNAAGNQLGVATNSTQQGRHAAAAAMRAVATVTVAENQLGVEQDDVTDVG